MIVFDLNQNDSDALLRHIEALGLHQVIFAKMLACGMRCSNYAALWWHTWKIPVLQDSWHQNQCFS
jgi:hypothetical protein